MHLDYLLQFQSFSDVFIVTENPFVVLLNQNLEPKNMIQKLFKDIHRGIAFRNEVNS